MKLPNFLVIGAPKAGTTSLCSYLGQHPEVGVSTPKETYFFINDDLYLRGVDWYSELFTKTGHATVLGEGTPEYSMVAAHPLVVARIRATLGCPKLVYMVRHPLERMESYYSQEVHNGWKVPSFPEAVRSRPSYIEGSRYGANYEAYASEFGKQNLHVIFFQDFKHDTAGCVRRVCDFLGVDFSACDFDFTQRNSREAHLEDTAAMRAVRAAPGFRWVAGNRERLLPRALRSGLKALLRRKPTRKAEWDQQTMQWAIDQVFDDSRAFLNRMGRSEDYWGDLTRVATE